MAEKSTMNLDEADPGAHENSTSNIPGSMQSEMLEKVEEKLEKVLEKLQHVQNQLDDQQKILTSFPPAPPKELKSHVAIAEPPVEKTTENLEEEEEQKIPVSSKQFVLKHVFEKIQKMEDTTTRLSDFEEYYIVHWGMSISRRGENVFIFLVCEPPESARNWSIRTDVEFKLINPNGKVWSRKMKCVFQPDSKCIATEIQWEELKNNYFFKSQLKVAVDARIETMIGIYKKSLRKFDESMRELSDVVLNVNNQKFHVAKLFLASHSGYFKAMFLGMFSDSWKSEITLTGIDPADFQKYLEVLYGYNAIDEKTVEGILLVADMYDTQIVVQKCEEFIIEKSTKPLRKKLQMSARYNLESLNKKCLAEIKTIDVLRSVTPVDVEDLDPAFMALLFKKALSFQ